MVAERRFGPVIVVLFLVLGALLVRLFQVQVLEHRVWAAEASSLVRTSRRVPSRRGDILDREGRPLVADEYVWQVDFVYRDFRRGHPLGIVAHARSTLEMRPVPLPEAFAHLEAWALELARLSSRDVATFREGGAIATPTLAVPEAADAKEELRSARAKDLAYYQEALLDVVKDERTWIKQHALDPALPYAAVLAAARGTTEAALLDGLRASLAKERERLSELARLLPARPNDAAPAAPAPGAPAPGGRGPGIGFDALLARLEGFRVRFEDAAADALFEKAVEFPPGRIASSTLARGFDLLWIARILRWDPARLAAWTGARRAAFEKDLDEIVVPRILVRAGLEPEAEVAGSILDGLASLYGREGIRTGWQDLDDVRVLSLLPNLLRVDDAPALEGKNPSGLPFLDEDLRDSAAKIEDPWLLLGTVAEMAGASLDGREHAGARDWAERWRAIAERDEHLEGPEAHAALAAIVAALERRFTTACDAAVEACLAEGAREAAKGHGRPGPLPLVKDAIERAEQEERFLVKDASSRAVRLANDADYALVHLLERDADLYAGFDVARATRRKILVRDPDGVPIARGLIGGVRGPTLRETLHGERRAEGRSDGEDDDAADEHGEDPPRVDERVGTSGIEAMFDAELRGRDGRLESTSLEEFESDGFLEPAIDGGDVVLTLDQDLQLAAEATIEHPIEPQGKASDPLWFANPVGAIVLLAPDGEVLAAASAPRKGGLPPTPGRDLERSVARERTLTKPTFNPPGSSIKPFVAAYALDRLGLDPNEEFGCGALDDGGYGYQDRTGTMHCHVGGHGRCNLEKALSVSCNATFAQIGERFRPEDFLDMARTFGFGLPTGIRRTEGDAPRKGLLEQAWSVPAALRKKLEQGRSRMQVANGLGDIEATPMQVARAMAGLVTGRLPDVRLVRKVAGRDVEARSTELPISKHARETVLRDLEGVTRPGGTAYDTGLDAQTLGFTFACKTGTADTKHIVGGSQERKDGQVKMRKQTWIVGWFPEKDPKAILVVMVHDVLDASTYSSAAVASQFLRSAAVRRFAAGDAPGAAETGGGKQ